MSVATESPRDVVSVRERDTERTDLPMLFQTTLPLRFWSKVYAAPNGCWLWRAGHNAYGYGVFSVPPTRKDRLPLFRFWSIIRAHRFAYELLVGPIPDGLTIDHLCRNRGCVNPAHMEVVTGRENTLRGDSPAARHARQTHCIHGHPFDRTNTYHWRNRRYCRECQRLVKVAASAKPAPKLETVEVEGG